MSYLLQVDLVSVVPGRYELRRTAGDDGAETVRRVRGLSQPCSGNEGTMDAVHYCTLCEDSRKVDTKNCMTNLLFCYGALRVRELLRRKYNDLLR